MSTLNLSRLSLFPATAEQILESRKRTAVQWSRGLSLEQYLERDNVMDSNEYAKDGKLTTWILAPRDDPGTLDFMCSCEVFRRTGVVARPTHDGHADLQEVPCYAIASVFTPESKRGEGYASHMLSLLHWVLAPESSFSTLFPLEWGSPPIKRLQDAAFSALYSDVGITFYRVRCSCLPNTASGWVTRCAISTQWKVQPMITEIGQWKWLSKEDAITVWDRDTSRMKDDAIAATSSGKTACAFLPNGGVGSFGIDRVMRFQGDSLTSISPFDTWGVKLVGGSTDEPLIYATWSLENAFSNIMVLTRLRVTASVFPSLLAKIMEIAKRHNLEIVETWSLPQGLSSVAAELGGVTFARKEHLPSIKWYGSEPEGEVQWLFNEKFCWC